MSFIGLVFGIIDAIGNQNYLNLLYTKNKMEDTSVNENYWAENMSAKTSWLTRTSVMQRSWNAADLEPDCSLFGVIFSSLSVHFCQCVRANIL